MRLAAASIWVTAYGSGSNSGMTGFTLENRRAEGMPGGRRTWRFVRHGEEWVRARAYRLSGGIRHPLRDGFTAYAVLSPATNSSCHRRRRILRLLNPVGLSEP